MNSEEHPSLQGPARLLGFALASTLLATPSSPGAVTGDAAATAEPAALQPVSRMDRLPAGALRRRVAALKKEDVAWRQIPWETSLIKGIQRSRREEKPILLWVFIDRPIDDERC